MEPTWKSAERRESQRVAVCSRSFSKNPMLRAELLARYRHATFKMPELQLSGDTLVAFLKGHEKAITALEVLDEQYCRVCRSSRSSANTALDWI